MKNYLLLLLSFVIVFAACKKDEEEQIEDQLTPKKDQWGFALNYTATWCGPCGNWGAPLIHEYADAGKVVAITAHASGDPMYNPALYGSFENVRTNGGGIPAFWVGDIKTTEMNHMDNLLSQTPLAGIAMSKTDNGSSMTVKTKTEFFEAGSGEYYLVVLLLESGIDGSSSAGSYSQNGVSNPATYKHDFVLRTSHVDGSVYGELIATDPTKGKSVAKEVTLTIDENWTNDVYPVVILWRKNLSGSPKYEFINAVL